MIIISALLSLNGCATAPDPKSDEAQEAYIKKEDAREAEIDQANRDPLSALLTAIAPKR